MNIALKSCLIGLTVSLPVFCQADESGVNPADIPSIITYPTYEKDASSIDVMGSAHWIQLKGQGSGWYGTDGSILGMQSDIETTGDRSIDKIMVNRYESVPWTWTGKSKTILIDRDRAGFTEYECPNNYLLTEVYYSDEGDHAIEAFRCHEIDDRYGYEWATANYFRYTFNSGGKVECFSARDHVAQTYVSWLGYRAGTDGYVGSMHCALVVPADHLPD